MNDLIERLRLGDGTSADHELLLEAADALEALAEPDQKPMAREQFYPDIGKPQLEFAPVKMVAYNCTCGRTIKFESEHGVVAPQRTWVGLTDQEVNDIVWNLPYEPSQEHIRAIEAKLKEKNT